MDIDKILFDLCDAVRPHLNERQRRLLAAAAAKSLGRGGVSRMARLTGMSRTTIHQGVRELAGTAGEVPVLASRQPGGGRKKATVVDPDLLSSLKELMAAEVCENEAALSWTCLSTRQLAAELAQQGHPVSHMVVADLLRQLGYRLYGNARIREEGAPSERKAQFRFISDTVDEVVRCQRPVLAIELRSFCCSATEDDNGSLLSGRQVDGSLKHGKDQIDRESIRFAAEALSRWIEEIGERLFPGMGRLLVCVGGDGSAGWAASLWRKVLKNVAKERNLTIDVCHIPPGTMKWSKVDHCLTHSIRRQRMIGTWSCYDVTIELLGNRRMRKNVYSDEPKPPEGAGTQQQESVASFHDLWNYSV